MVHEATRVGVCRPRRSAWPAVVTVTVLLGTLVASRETQAQMVAASSTSSAARPADVTLPSVQVNAGRLDVPAFDLPASLSQVEVDAGRAGQAGVNLSEALVGVPGILARDRQNYAQDEQISIRGFGARASFGVRSIRLYVDGIPATLPDGQGQVSHFNLDSAERVEVLRGPFSVLYGNAAGGVIQLWSATGSAIPQTTLGVYAGGHDTFRFSASTRGKWGDAVDYNVSASEFLSAGYRDHSRVRRESDNAKFGIDLGERRRLVLVFNRLNQPDTQDPLGLTRAQATADPAQATSVASQYDTRKSIRQNQLGVIYEQQGDADQWRAMGYYGQRSIVQYLSIPPATQVNPLQSGGVISPDTDYGGVDLRWTHSGALADRDYEFVLGASIDDQRQRRTGYENFVGNVLGVRGALRRDENDNVIAVAQYAQWYWRVAERWSLLLGLRHDEVRFSEHDFYQRAGNPDDSGNVAYAATTPVLGVQLRPAENLRLHASFGRGFETPSYNELGYRSDGQAGLAFNLRPARSRNMELGAKWKISPALELDAAAFRADTSDELAVATNRNGRASYRNVGDARRQGVEASLAGELGQAWRVRAGLTHLQARFRSGFLTCSSTPCGVANTTVSSGARIPGVPDNYGSLRVEHGNDVGWREGLTASGVGAVTVNDNDTQRAPGYGLLDLDVSYGIALQEGARLQLSARVDNLADRRYIGSVIVNDGNGRYFEPGPDRTWMLGARLTF